LALFAGPCGSWPTCLCAVNKPIFCPSVTLSLKIRLLWHDDLNFWVVPYPLGARTPQFSLPRFRLFSVWQFVNRPATPNWVQEVSRFCHPFLSFFGWVPKIDPPPQNAFAIGRCCGCLTLAPFSIFSFHHKFPSPPPPAICLAYPNPSRRFLPALALFFLLASALLVLEIAQKPGPRGRRLQFFF